MRWFRRKNDGKGTRPEDGAGNPEDGVKRPEGDTRGAGDVGRGVGDAVRGGDGAGAPQPDSTVHPGDAVALGLDQLGLASAGRPEDGGSIRPESPVDASHSSSANAPPAGALEPAGESRPAGASSEPGAPGQDVDPEKLREAIVDVLRTVYDPEIPVNIYEIGLIYKLDVSPEGHVEIEMTLTSPMCPVAESLPPEVEAKVASVRGVNDVKLDLVWDPPWNPSMMSEEARLLLNIG